MKDDDFKLLRGFASWRTDRLTDERMDIGESRVAFATEKSVIIFSKNQEYVIPTSTSECLFLEDLLLIQ